MNLLDRIAYDTGGYTVQEILSSFSKKILEIIDLVNKNEGVCDEAHAIIENIRNEVVPDLVDDIIKEMQDSGYFDSLVNVTLIENLRNELTTLLNDAITNFTTRLDNNDTLIADKFLEIQNYLETQLNSLISKTNIIMSVKEYGAKGDGVTDDTEAIGDCLTYCVQNNKTMYFPNGVYCVSHGFLPVPSKNHALKNNLVSILGESHLGVTFKRIGTGEDPFIFDFKWCNKVYAENLSSPDFSFNTLDNEAYWQGNDQWALALREKDFYLKNLIYTGDGGATSYYTYINSPCPKNYTRYADGNYAKYPLEITSGSGYNAININNFATNEDGSIGEPQDNSAIGIVDRVNNSTGTIFIDMIGNRSFERYVNRNATICSEVRPQTVWEIHRNGHIAIGCSVDEQDPVARGWAAIKIRDNSPKIELFDANNDNEKLTIGQVKQDWGQEFYVKFGNAGLTMVKDEASGNVIYNGFRWGGINGGLKVNIGDNPVESGIVLNRGSINAPLTLDSNGDLRFGGNHKSSAEEYSRVYCVHGGESYFRPKLSNHWKDIGYMYFDTDIGKPIWWNGTKWVYSNAVGV